MSPTISDLATAQSANGAIATCRGIAGNSKISAFVRGDGIVCYLTGPSEWQAEQVGKAVHVGGRVRVHTARGGDGEEGGVSYSASGYESRFIAVR